MLPHMKIKYKIAFKLRAFGRKTVRYQIRLRFSFNNQRTDITTGWNLDTEDAWEPETQTVKQGYVGSHGETAADINLQLQMMRDHLENAFKYFEGNDIIPTPSQVVKRYEERVNGVAPKRPAPEKKKQEKPEPKFYDTYQQFLIEAGDKNAWTEATYQKMAALKEDLTVFKKSIKFSDITETWLTSFVHYLRDEKQLKTPRKKKGDREDYDADDLVGIKNSTIEKKLGYLRWFLNWATDKGYNTNMAYKTFKPTLKSTQKKVIYLTKEELARIRGYEIPEDKSYLEAVRDVFFFCCFSGLRHSDVYNLRRNDVKGDHIEVTTVKTADSISIDLNKVTRELLDKYKDFDFPGNKVLPVIKNQPMNRDLKELCKLAGIDDEIRITTYKGNQRIDEIKKKHELVGTHTGRRTFIVNALSRGIAPNVVMKWTGHSDYKAMKPYIDIVDSIRAKEMTKMDFMD